MNFEKQYEKNLKFIKKVDESLYENILNDSLDDMELILNDDESFNIKHKGNMIYPINSKKAINDQVNSFLDKPSSFYDIPNSYVDVKVAKFTSSVSTKITIQSPIIIGNKYWKKNRLEYNQRNSNTKINTIPVLMLFGIGSGEYIERILSSKKVLELIIVDYTISFLKLSMHLIDWERIFNLCTNVKIIINDVQTIGKNVIDHIFKNSVVFLPRIDYYVHIESSYSISSINYIRENMRFAKFGWGFYEDEILSLSHTLANIKNVKYVMEGLNSFNYPIVLIGGGPSLDNDIEVLKQIKNKVFIISCGSGLRTLWKNNIKPNFHVETERKLSTFNTFKYIDKEYLKEITLVGLNVLHPRVKSLFKEFIMFFRSNDSGSSLFRSYKVYEYPVPTCVNAGFELALSMNPKTIYTLGNDCGFRNSSAHHAKDNIHVDSKTKYFKKSVEPLKNIKLKGNFEGSFLTTRTLNVSKNSFEECFLEYSKRGCKTKVYNCSDGAYITNLVPRVFNIHDFINDEDINIQMNNIFTKTINNLNTGNTLLSSLNTMNSILVEFERVYNTKSVKNVDEAIMCLYQLHNIINNLYKYNQISYSLLSGSTKVFFTIIYSHLINSESLEEIDLKFFKNGVEEVIKFIKKVTKNYEILIRNYK